LWTATLGPGQICKIDLKSNLASGGFSPIRIVRSFMKPYGGTGNVERRHVLEDASGEIVLGVGANADQNSQFRLDGTLPIDRVCRLLRPVGLRVASI
jgi:hypothetical protein